MAVAANRLGGLQQVLELGKVGIGVAVINESIEIFGGLPDALLPARQGEILLFLFQHIVDSLILMIEPVELRDSWSRFFVVLPELRFRFAFFVAALNEIVSLFQIGKRFCCRTRGRCTHELSPRLLPKRFGIIVSLNREN